MNSYSYSVSIVFEAVKKNFGQARIGDITRILEEEDVTRRDVSFQIKYLMDNDYLVRDKKTGLYLIKKDPIPREMHYFDKLDSNYERIDNMLEELNEVLDIDELCIKNAQIGGQLENIMDNYVGAQMKKLIDFDEFKRRDIPNNIKARDYEEVENQIINAIKTYLNYAPKQKIIEYCNKKDVKMTTTSKRIDKLVTLGILSKEGNTNCMNYSLMDHSGTKEHLLLSARAILYEQEDMMEILHDNGIICLEGLRQENKELIISIENRIKDL